MEKKIKALIVKNLNGLRVYYSLIKDKPITCSDLKKNLTLEKWETDKNFLEVACLPTYMFPEVKWSDEEPTKIEITIKKDSYE